jgi:hypothetical protein
MARTSDSHVRASFDHYCKAFGFKRSKGFNTTTKTQDPGLALDHGLGGWNIVEYKGGSSGQYQPFGAGRMSSGDFYAALWFAIRSLEYKRSK